MNTNLDVTILLLYCAFFVAVATGEVTFVASLVAGATELSTAGLVTTVAAVVGALVLVGTAVGVGFAAGVQAARLRSNAPPANVNATFVRCFSIPWKFLSLLLFFEILTE